MATESREREENARRILTKLDEGVPFESIFPQREVVTPAPVITHWLIFTAVDLPSPHGGSTMRSYILDCRHATSQKELMDMDATRDGEVLGPMLREHRERVAKAEHGICDCWPKGWSMV